MTNDLGFNNTYALVMRRDHADQLAIKTISDLRTHPELKFGLTHEFLERHDGWQPLSARYQLAPAHVLGIDHGLGYSALAKGEIDVKDAYSTDAKIGDYGLVTLIDDLEFFPQYKAVFLYRKTLSPEAAHALNDLSNSIDEAREFCRGGLPHAIVVESVLRGDRFNEMRSEVDSEGADVVFIEIIEEGNTFEISGFGGRNMARVGRDAIMTSLPSALMFELSKTI